MTFFERNLKSFRILFQSCQIVLSKVSSGFQISPEMRGLKLGKIRMSQGPEVSVVKKGKMRPEKILKAGVDFLGV